MSLAHVDGPALPWLDEDLDEPYRSLRLAAEGLAAYGNVVVNRRYLRSVLDELAWYAHELHMVHGELCEAKRTIRGRLGSSPPPVPMEQIISTVCERLDVDPDDMRERDMSDKQPPGVGVGHEWRVRSATDRARLIAVYLVCELSGVPQEEVGRRFGGRGKTRISKMRIAVQRDVQRHGEMSGDVLSLFGELRPARP